MTPLLRRWWPALAGLAVLGAVFALPLAGGGSSRTASVVPATATATPSAVARTAVPGILAVSSATPPRAGEARLLAGPFTDRLRLLRLSLQAGTARGTFAQVADNSALLVMEVQADFYDARGTLLGSRRTVLRQPDVVAAAQGGTGVQRFGGNIVFAVGPARAWATQVAGVLVSVPTLVNE